MDRTRMTCGHKNNNKRAEEKTRGYTQFWQSACSGKLDKIYIRIISAQNTYRSLGPKQDNPTFRTIAQK
eukprot:755019-Heterocapsa_arctica.AAC.1